MVFLTKLRLVVLKMFLHVLLIIFWMIILVFPSIGVVLLLLIVLLLQLNFAVLMVLLLLVLIFAQLLFLFLLPIFLWMLIIPAPGQFRCVNFSSGSFVDVLMNLNNYYCCDTFLRFGDYTSSSLGPTCVEQSGMWCHITLLRIWFLIVKRIDRIMLIRAVVWRLLLIPVRMPLLRICWRSMRVRLIRLL